MTTKNAGIDKDLIRDLAEILNDTNLSDIEIEDGQTRIRVSRQVVQAAPVVQHVQAVPVASANVVSSSMPTSSEPAAIEQDTKNAVTSPMVGTAYLAPAPGKPSFVSVGQTVSKGDPLLIIEAMKTMNQIPSPRDGVVKAILVANAQPVEFGEPLVIVE